MTIRPRVLLVEGKDELRVLPELLERCGVAWPRGREPVFIQDLDGVDEILAPGSIEAQLKASGLAALGIIVDADDNPAARWGALCSRLRAVVPGFPQAIGPAGVVHRPAVGPAVGVWIMPDNAAEGMLETMLAGLRTGEHPMKDHAQASTARARELGAPFREAHAGKAELHAWLAWQDPPGQQLHIAVKAGALSPEASTTSPFVVWFRDLFQV
jgi:hypothetical protein